MLEDFRDVMIIISAFLVIASALLFSVLTIVIFRKVYPTVDAARGFFSDLRTVSSFVSGKAVKPLTTGAIFTAGIRKAIVTLSKRSHGWQRKIAARASSPAYCWAPL